MRGVEVRHGDLLHHERRNGVDDVLPVAHMVVERPGRDVEGARQPVRRERREPLAPRDVKRLARDEPAAQGDSGIPGRPAPAPPRRRGRVRGGRGRVLTRPLYRGPRRHGHPLGERGSRADPHDRAAPTRSCCGTAPSTAGSPRPRGSARTGPPGPPEPSPAVLRVRLVPCPDEERAGRQPWLTT